MEQNGEQVPIDSTKLDKLGLYSKVTFEGREYDIRMINRNSGDLLAHPVMGGAYRWMNVNQVELVKKED